MLSLQPGSGIVQAQRVAMPMWIGLFGGNHDIVEVGLELPQATSNSCAPAGISAVMLRLFQPESLAGSVSASTRTMPR